MVVLEVSLAGAISLRRDGRRVADRTFSGRQLRLVTAMIVLERADPISVETLAAELWPETVPDHWRVAVRGLVMKLRRLLADVGVEGEPIRGDRGRYWVHLGPIKVDLEAATVDLVRARELLGAGEAERARVEAGRARAVLSRPVLSGVHSPWVDRLRDRVGHQHIDVLTVLGEGRSQLGLHEQARTVLEEALALDMLREDTWRGVMRAEAAAGNRARALHVYDRCRRLLADELGVDPSAATQRLYERLLSTLPASATVTTPVALTEPGSIGEPEMPYVGLRAFDTPDASRFFGRDGEIQELVDRLGQGAVVVVVGPSGAGKSSLVRAGLLPALARGAIPDSDTWVPVLVGPGSEPIKSLTAALEEISSRLSAAAVESLLAEDEDGLLLVARQLLADRDPSARVLVVVDQFEETFTLGTDAQTERFARLLVAAASCSFGRVAVVLTLRADFYDRAAGVGALAEVLSHSQFVVPPLEGEAVEQAVLGPARATGMMLEDGLLARILTDVAGEPGSLPLLQHLLFELWQHRTDRVMTRGAYEDLGGVAGALAQRAEMVLRGMPDVERQVARRVLLRCVQPGEATGDARRPVLASELVGPADDPSKVDRVVARLVDARLLTATVDVATGGRTIELTHEAIIHGWPRLGSWVDESRRWLVDHRRLTAAAQEWDRHDRHDDWLLTGAPLEQAHELLLAEDRGEADLHLSPVEQDLMVASVEARREAEAREEARRTHERGLELRSLRRFRALVAAMTVAAVITAGFTVVSVRQSGRLGEQARIETARRLAGDALANLRVDADRSILLALAAVEVTREVDGTVLPEAESVLHQAVSASRLLLTVPEGGDGGIGFTSDGSAFVTAGRDDTAVVWDAGSGERTLTLTGHDGAVNAAGFSPDDALIATAGADGTVRLWDTASGQQLHVLHGHDGGITGLAFSPDGQLLASAGGDGTIRLWDRVSAIEVRELTGHTDWVWSVDFSPDGTQLISGSFDTTARVWDVATGDVLAVLEGHLWQLRAAFSPDGTRAATASADASLRIWDVASAQEQNRVFQPDPFEAVAYSPSGDRFATAGNGGETRLWDTDTGEQLLALPGHAGPTTSVAFSPDGQRLLTTGVDGLSHLWDLTVGGARDWVTVPGAKLIHSGVAFSPDGATFAAPAEPTGVAIWDTRTGQQVTTLADHEGSCGGGPARPCKLTDLAFSPDGARLVAGSDHVHAPPVWDVATGELLFVLDGGSPDIPIRTVAYSPDGSRIATGSYAGNVVLWDATTGTELHRMAVVGGGLPEVAFTPDGSHLVTGDDDGGVAIWEATSLAPVSSLDGHRGPITDLAFGTDGTLATASGDGTAGLWDLGSGERTATLSGHEDIVWQVALGPDGTVATTGQDGTARLWDPVTERSTLTLQSHGRLLYGVALSPDQRLLATGSPDGTIALHVLPLDEFLEVARSRVTRALTDDECRRYLLPGHCA